MIERAGRLHRLRLCHRLCTLLGADYSSSQISYDCVDLRLHGLIERGPSTNYFTLTSEGIRVVVVHTSSMVECSGHFSKPINPQRRLSFIALSGLSTTSLATTSRERVSRQLPETGHKIQSLGKQEELGFKRTTLRNFVATKCAASQLHRVQAPPHGGPDVATRKRVLLCPRSIGIAHVASRRSEETFDTHPTCRQWPEVRVLFVVRRVLKRTAAQVVVQARPD
jgi:hypothetical protein